MKKKNILFIFIFLPTVSGPITFDGGGTARIGFRNSGPGLLRDSRFLVVDKSTALVRGDALPMPPPNELIPPPPPRPPPPPPPNLLISGLAARSRP